MPDAVKEKARTERPRKSDGKAVSVTAMRLGRGVSFKYAGAHESISIAKRRLVSSGNFLFAREPNVGDCTNSRCVIGDV